MIEYVYYTPGMKIFYDSRIKNLYRLQSFHTAMGKATMYNYMTNNTAYLDIHNGDIKYVNLVNSYLGTLTPIERLILGYDE